MAEKTVNYTEEMTVALVNAYKEGKAIEDLAVMFSRSTRSIIAKLSREGAYVKKAVSTDKNGNTVIKKDKIADQIGMLLNMTESEIESISKANKTALTKILDCVKEAKLSSADLVM